MQDTSVDVGCFFGCKGIPYVRSNSIYVVHHHTDVWEDMVVDALKDIVGSVCFAGLYFICIVDEAFAQRIDFADSPFEGELLHYVCQFGVQGLSVYIMLWCKDINIKCQKDYICE